MNDEIRTLVEALRDCRVMLREPPVTRGDVKARQAAYDRCNEVLKPYDLADIRAVNDSRRAS